MRQENLDFEITFYEDLVRDKPDFVDALVALGDAYSKKGFYEKGLAIDKKLLEIDPQEPTFHYNLSCDYSLLKEPDSCLESLAEAIRLGYTDLEHIEKDPDLDYVRHNPRFKELLASIRAYPPERVSSDE
ncbi:MAG: hypothetical protein WCG78_07795 [Candidatus Omnitrophota bacterium]